MVKKRINSEWYKFQEEIKRHFESLGAIAHTNMHVQGVRAKHDIDVLVELKFFGKEVKWVIEAKNWRGKVPKEKAMALLSIAQDIGADRGFIISKNGFQKGAIDCVRNTNIYLTTFEELQFSTRSFVSTEIISQYKARARLLQARYFAHPKRLRSKYGIRHDICEPGLSPFSGNTIISFIWHAIYCMEKRTYPIGVNTGLEVNAGERLIDDFPQACNWLNLNLNLLDSKILEAEVRMMENGEFNPNVKSLAKAFVSQANEEALLRYSSINAIIIDFLTKQPTQGVEGELQDIIHRILNDKT